MKYDIFICYRREGGAQYARILQLMLAQRGYKVFLDYDDVTDGIFSETIKDAIKEASIFMLVLSKDSLDRCANEDDWVRREIQYASMLQKHFIPVNPDNQFNKEPDDCPEDIRKIVALNQHSGIQFGQHLGATIDFMIKKRIAPKVGKRRTSSHIDADFDAANESLMKLGEETSATKEDSPNQDSPSSQSKEKKAQTQTSPDSPKTSRQRKWIFGIMAATILLLASAIVWGLASNTRPHLVFIGGGSVAGLIKDIGKINIKDYGNSIYIHMPTENIWPMLKEDYAEYLAFDKDIDKMQYVSLCMAATKIEKDSLMKLINSSEDFQKYAVVIQFFIGNDTLKLYVQETLCQELGLPKDSTSIDIETLDSIIDKKRNNGVFTIYSTNKESGTLKTYQDLIGNKYSLKALIDSGIIKTFNRVDQTPTGGFVIMGSKYYSWNGFDTEGARSGFRVFPIKKGTKPTYLYFLAYRKNNEPFKIPSPILRFLNKAGFIERCDSVTKEKIKDGTFNSNNIIDSISIKNLK